MQDNAGDDLINVSNVDKIIQDAGQDCGGNLLDKSQIGNEDLEHQDVCYQHSNAGAAEEIESDLEPQHELEQMLFHGWAPARTQKNRAASKQYPRSESGEVDSDYFKKFDLEPECNSEPCCMACHDVEMQLQLNMLQDDDQKEQNPKKRPTLMKKTNRSCTRPALYKVNCKSKMIKKVNEKASPRK